MRRPLLLVAAILPLTGCSQPHTPRGPNGAAAAFRTNLGFVPSAVRVNTLKPEWTFTTGNAVRSTPLLLEGVAYVGSGDGLLYAIDRQSGAARWSFDAGSPVHSSPAAALGLLFVQDAANVLHAISIGDGSEVWRDSLGATLPYQWGFDYWTSSPRISQDTLYIGSGDGHLYAIDARTGTVHWRYDAGARLRSTPWLADGVAYIGDFAGRVHAVDAATGNRRWVFATVGDTLDSEQFGFDRRAIIASPAGAGDLVVVGGRDGFLYALNRSTGAQAWRFDYDVSWVISTVAIHDSIVVVGTSDGRFINALDLSSGRELWRQPTGVVWSSPVIVGDRVVTASTNGFMYLHDLSTGREIDRVKIATERFFSSPAVASNQLVIGNDDGRVYAFSLTHDSLAEAPVRRLVFFDQAAPYHYFGSGTDRQVRDFFVASGYEAIGPEALQRFLRAAPTEPASSVIVFATNYFPAAVTRPEQRSPSLLHAYLLRGGKVVVMGPNPGILDVSEDEQTMVGFDYSLSAARTGISYSYKDLRSHGGVVPSTITRAGREWGLTTGYVSHSGLPPETVTPLAMGEDGTATSFVYGYGGAGGRGFVQAWLSADDLSRLPDIRRVAEYGLRRSTIAP